jgi:hypothetical protein
MKTDRILTTEEYLNKCSAIPMHVDPPAPGAPHVRIGAAEDVDSPTEMHACRCDRWGHPYSDCPEGNLQNGRRVC